MKRSKTIDELIKTINLKEYESDKDEKFLLKLKYLTELKNYVISLEKELENKDYIIKQEKMKVSKLLSEKLEQINKYQEIDIKC